MTKMMANQSFDSVHALYGCPVRLFVLKTSKLLPNKARKKNKKNLKKTKKNVLKQLKKTSFKKNMFFYISNHQSPVLFIVFKYFRYLNTI